MNRFSLSAKLFVWIFLCAMVPVMVLTGFYLSSFKDALLQQEKEHLSQFADKKVEQVEVYIEKRISDVKLMSQLLESEQLLTSLIPLYKNSVKQSEEYYLQENKYRPFFKLFEERGNYDVFFISPMGEIVFSLSHESDFSTNIYSGPFRKSGLNKVAQRARFFLEASSSSFEYYPPSKEAAAFIAAPVLRNGKLLGVVALQVDSEIIQNITLDVGGSMRSREVVVASRYGDKFSYQAQVRYDKSIKVGHELPISDLPYPLYKAISGIRSIAVEVDYRGVKVIAASRFLPSMHWGMVFKEDYDEAMEVFDRLLYISILVLLLLTMGALLVAKILGGVVAKPLMNLTDVTHSIALGNMDLEVKMEGYKESYELAKSFNKMSTRLKDARSNLEHKVADRTFELEQEMKLRKQNEQDLEKSYLQLSRSMLHLKTAQDQLIESEKMASLGSLVAGIAHDINTPLGVAITSTSLFKDNVERMNKALKNKSLTEGVFKRYLQELQEIVSLLENNLGQTANLVKNFKQVAVDQTNLHKAKFYLFELVESLLSSLKPETRKYPVKIINTVPEDIVVDSYSGDFYQLLTNLILNAMIHGFEGKEEGVLTINALIDGTDIILKIKDNGIGIKENVRRKIFEPFYTSKRDSGGSGLGLSIVSNIVKQKLNGEIEVHSELGKGTEFVIRFPQAGE